MKHAWLLLLACLAVTACQQTKPPGNGANQPPQAAVQASVTQGVAPLAVAFDASGSSDPDGVIAAYSWQFGDGGVASGRQVAHTFTVPGQYRVALTVTDNLGGTGQAETRITVLDAGGTLPLTASFTATPEGGAAPLDVTFDASASSGPEGVTYAWAFGDGATGTGVTASHRYPGPGEFTATLRVNGGGGATASATAIIRVTAGTAERDPRILAGLTLPGELAAFEQEAASRALEAVVAATQAAGSGALVTTGTLTQTSETAFQYDPVPPDRLRVVFTNGATVEYLVSALEGDFDAPSIEAFLRRPHQFVFRVVLSGGTDLSVSLTRSASALQNRVAGTLASEGVVYAVDLASQGTYSSSVGSAAEYESETFIQGTLSAPGFAATVNERRYFRYFQFENAIEINQRDLDNRWTVGAERYALTGVVKRNYFNGKPSEFDLWRAEGTLTRDGAVVGGIGSEFTEFTIDIFLTLDGEKTIISSDLLS